MRSSRLCQVAAVFLAAAFALGTATAATAAGVTPGAITVAIRPADEANYFHLNVLPGETVERKAVVSNFSSAPVDLLIYPADATTTAQGGFALAERGAPARQLGSWIHLPITELHLAAHANTTVTFHVAVPAGIQPGDYAGGILVQSMTPGQTTTGNKDFPFQVNIIQRIGARAYLHVAGTAEPGLNAGRLTWQATAHGITFSIPITNTGNIRLQPTAQIRLSGWNLPTNVIPMSRVEDLQPGATVTITGQLANPPRYGYGHATAHIDYGSSQHATAVTTVRLIPVLLTLALLAAVAVLLFAGWKFTRFLRRARVALRQAQSATARNRLTHHRREATPRR